MNRRTLLCIGSIALLAPRIVRGQAPPRIYRVAYVGRQRLVIDGIFRERLAEHGFVEGKNLEFRSFAAADATPEDFSSAAREALAWKPDVIRVYGTKNVRLVAALISTVPIVFGSVADPVENGLVASLARPGGNLTGAAAMQLASKRLELARQLLPRAKRVALIVDSTFPSASAEAMKEILATARGLGFTVEVFDPSGEPRHYVGALESIAKTRPDALIPVNGVPDARDFAALGVPESLQITVPGLLADFQRVHMIPVIFWDGIERGLLATLGGTQREQAQIAADQTAKIFRGTPVGEIPIQQHLRIEVSINLKAAKELGITVPESVLRQADTVIE